MKVRLLKEMLNHIPDNSEVQVSYPDLGTGGMITTSEVLLKGDNEVAKFVADEI